MFFRAIQPKESVIKHILTWYTFYVNSFGVGIPIILGADDWLHTACKNIYSRYRQQREKYAALRQEQSVSCQSNILST